MTSSLDVKSAPFVYQDAQDVREILGGGWLHTAGRLYLLLFGIPDYEAFVVMVVESGSKFFGRLCTLFFGQSVSKMEPFRQTYCVGAGFGERSVGGRLSLVLRC
jgi:hypothetical protein